MHEKEEMRPDTLEALNSSIEHWTKIVAGEEGSEGAANCALCALFSDEVPNDDTTGYITCIKLNFENDDYTTCPVQEYTGREGCEGTPYEYFNMVGERTNNSFAKWAKSPNVVKAAQDELDFLKSLLPKKETPNE